jgi:hypothetical protein
VTSSIRSIDAHSWQTRIREQRVMRTRSWCRTCRASHDLLIVYHHLRGVLHYADDGNMKRRLALRQSPLQRRRWVATRRMQLLKHLTAASRRQRFSRRLFVATLRELGADETLASLIGEPTRIPTTRYGQAIAMAILLRHSWRPDDLANCAVRLGLQPYVRPSEHRRGRGSGHG